MFNHEEFYSILEAIKEHLRLGVAIGDNPGVSLPGGSGKSLEFTWSGTKLGIRVEGDKAYKYMDLKGDDGETPHIDAATNHWFVGTIDTGVDARGSRGLDGVTPTFKIGTITTLPEGAKATATITGTSAAPVLNLGIPVGASGDPATNTDEKVKLGAGTPAKYLSELVDSSTIVVDTTSGTIKVVTIEGLKASVTALNFVKNLDKDIMTYLSAISNPMGFKGVVADDAALAAVTGSMNGDTYIVKSSASNGGKTMTFIYNGTDFVPIAETTVSVRDFTTNPLNLVTEVTGLLGEGNIASTIARVSQVLDKANYEGSAVGIVKQADKLTGLTASATDLQDAVTKRHNHANKSALDNILSSGTGELALFDDGVYRKIFSVGNTAPSIKGIFWVDTTTPAKPILKYNDGTNWVAVSSVSTSSGGTTVTVDTSMSSSSTNPVQNRVIKKYVDDSIPAISTDAGNAISTDSSGDWFVQDKTDDIKENSDRIKEIQRHKKYLNNSLEYCSVGFQHDTATVTSSGGRSINVALNTDIPFDKVYQDGGLTFNAANHSILLKAGSTYELTGQSKASSTDDGHIIRFYNLTDGKYLSNGARIYTMDESDHIEEIITPSKDIEVTLRVAWCSRSNNMVTMRTCAINNTAQGAGISSSQTRMNEVYMIAKEIGRTLTIDPLDYVNTKDGIEDMPVGTVIPLMSNSVPAHYLKCDGSVYNITDYPYLAQHIKNEFGSNNYWGGNGTTTFAVPDLRGEFLRGTGAATRATGTGSVVGAHQNGTGHVNYNTQYNGILCAPTKVSNKTTSSGNDFGPTNIDTTTSMTDYKWDITETVVQPSKNRMAIYTSRPTNTAVLWCIKAEPTYFMHVEGKDVYSKDEHVVGYWYDGKPLYQKTMKLDALPDNSSANYPHGLTNLDFIFVSESILVNPVSGNTSPLAFPGADGLTSGSSSETTVFVNKTNVVVRSMMTRSDCHAYVTIRYTKTTDVARP